MTDFLNALKADLTDRRLLPLVALVVLALVGAIGYAALGGGGSTSTPTAVLAPRPPVAATGALAVSAENPEKAVAETPDGSSQQRQGVARDPFTPLPGGAKASTSVVRAASSVTASASSSTSSTASGSSSSKSKTETRPSTGSGAASPTSSTPSKPSAPAKSKTIYRVSVLFGAIPAGETPLTVRLRSFQDLKLQTPLPFSTHPLLVFRGVTLHGKSATFTLLGEAILHGSARCLPSASQCQAIDLRPGSAEQLEYLSASGQSTVYELRVASIVAGKASAAAVKSMLRAESKIGRELLRHDGLARIPYLHYSGEAGVLVFSTHRAFAARAGRRRGR